MHRDDGLVAAHSPVNDTRHELVPLRVELAVGALLRNAVRELAIAEVMVRRDLDRRRPVDPSLRWIIPVDVEAPCEEDAVLPDLLELRTARGEHDVRRACR